MRPVALSATKIRGDCIVLMEGKQTAECSVEQSYEQGCTLQDYMADAATHFSSIQLPLGGKISTVDKQTIELVVPRIALFDVWLQPRAQCKLVVFDQRIEFTSTTDSCKLDGSSHVKDFKLDERFDLNVLMKFDWKNTRDSNPRKLIRAQGDISIEVDIPPPFSFVPKPVLTSTANAALGGVISIILQAFVSKMAEDYGRWVRDQTLYISSEE
jgi:hypothetical protein